jgi:hypothetical protein
MSEPISPAFMFGRRRDIELETGLVLAGKLVVDLPKDAKLERGHERMIVDIMQYLTAVADSGQMQDDGIVFGWRDGRRPDNADDFVNSNEVQTKWAESRLIIDVRIDLRDDGMMRVDSDLLRQMGIIKEH